MLVAMRILGPGQWILGKKETCCFAGRNPRIHIVIYVKFIHSYILKTSIYFYVLLVYFVMLSKIISRHTIFIFIYIYISFTKKKHPFPLPGGYVQSPASPETQVLGLSLGLFRHRRLDRRRGVWREFFELVKLNLPETSTPPKTNMEGPKMTPYLKPEIHLKDHHFWYLC